MAAVFLLFCVFLAGRDDSRMFSAGELAGSALYIENHTCPRTFSARRVNEAEVCEEVISLCKSLKKFRYIAVTEMILGCVMDERRTAIFLCGEEYRIQISFSDPEGQLSYDSEHRENPVVIASRSGPDGEKIWGGYCTLPPDDYAKLYDLVYGYEEGELVRKIE
mgnify:FL=1